MDDISQHLPEHSKTVKAIYAHYKKAGDEKQYLMRSLGASQVGHPCERYLWYLFRHCCQSEFDGRMYRLFETGNLEEARFVKDLRAIGCTVHEVDSNGKQFKVTALGGHLAGHLDGCALGISEAPKTWHVLEFKTHSAKSFWKLVKEGVMKSKPQHYAQMMVYMHLTGMKRALYLAVNKDIDDLYSERIRYDKTEAERLMERAKRVITATSPPERISNRMDFYQCSWCDAKSICWGAEPLESALPIQSFSCRQCCHATPQMKGEDGKWDCNKHNLVLIDGRRGCEHHLILPGLISFAEPTDYGQDEEGYDFIEFTNEDGRKWRHGSASGSYSSKELMKLPATHLTNEVLCNAKDLFGATVTDHQEDILKRYSENEVQTVWVGPANDLVEAWKTIYAEELLELEPLARCDFPLYKAVEMHGGRIAIIWENSDQAEIRWKREIPF